MSDFSFEIYDRKNITLDQTKTYARLMCDAFKNDLVDKAFNSVDDSLEDSTMPSIYDFEKLRHKIDVMTFKVENLSRDAHLAFLKEDRNRLCLLKSKGDYLAAAFFSLPEYAVPETKLSLFEHLKFLWLKIYYTLTKCPELYPLSALRNEFVWARSKTGISDDPQAIDTLKHSSQEQLDTMGYPATYAYFLKVLAVRSDQHGKGVGRVFMDLIESHITSIALPPPDLTPQAKAKIVLQSAPTARGFYKKIGFTCGGTASHLVNNMMIDHSSFFKDI